LLEAVEKFRSHYHADININKNQLSLTKPTWRTASR